MSAPDPAVLSNIPHFRDVTGYDPYPWQGRLYQSLLTGAAPTALDIPTGIGKTTAVLLYLLALAAGATLPRRLVYVVDRRAVVDQTADQIRRWMERIAAVAPLAGRLDALAAFPAPAPVALGVLRGGLADDGDWRIDPARPAVIVGTVDMIGSRLLFSSYGDGQSRRAQHAGLLGQDSFLLLDEAHLSPGMAGLIRGIERLRSDGERPGFRALTLSATPDSTDQAFSLDAADLDHPELCRRFRAPKTLLLETVADNARRIDRIVELAAGFQTGSILIFVHLDWRPG
jgi:CRISPR-associated endonuclease/helicase Cas3